MSTLYWNGGDGDWGNILNWFTNVGVSIPAGRVPTSADDAISVGSNDLSGNTGAPAVAKSFTANGTGSVIDFTLTVTNGAILSAGCPNNTGLNIVGTLEIHGAMASGGTCTGDVKCYDTVECGTLVGGDLYLFGNSFVDPGAIDGSGKIFVAGLADGSSWKPDHQIFASATNYQWAGDISRIRLTGIPSGGHRGYFSPFG